MKMLHRLDVQLTLIFVAVLSATVSLTGWIHQRGHLINMVGPHFQYDTDLVALEPALRAFEAAPEQSSFDSLLQRLAPMIPADRLLLIVDDRYQVIAETTPENALIELVRKEPDPNFFVVATSSRSERFDFILMFHMLPYREIRGRDRRIYTLLMIPRPFLIDPPEIRPILFEGLRHHFEIFGFFYAGVILFFVVFIRRRLLPLRRIETAAHQLIERHIPPPIETVVRRDEVGRLVQAFNTALEQLAANEAVRKRMVSDIAHELRTPLTVLSGRIEAYQDGLIDDAPGLIQFTAAQIDDLTRIVEDLALLSRFDAGKLELHYSRFPIKAALAEMLRASALGQTFTWKLTGEEHPVFLDRNRFKQIIGNLTRNAVKARGEGLILTITIGLQDGTTVIRFADNGPGVPPESLPLLFERLYRVDAARTADKGGSGLGLSIVKSLVEAQQGSIHCELPPSGGLAFEIRLPSA
ncbi:HAMP domain-containing protein [Acanthopleuribacter pedis]|uniref:Signal transduction histidine-protein kinase/phosphatase MprB n=2 Tax=Acanthopleuribacter pedis TaxID=442870 RepID=A0A8J7QDG4_9BACT|nr:HAMP domain-containing protein [Acanthopleuribacter pedis]